MTVTRILILAVLATSTAAYADLDEGAVRRRAQPRAGRQGGRSPLARAQAVLAVRAVGVPRARAGRLRAVRRRAQPAAAVGDARRARLERRRPARHHRLHRRRARRDAPRRRPPARRRSRQARLQVLERRARRGRHDGDRQRRTRSHRDCDVPHAAIGQRDTRSRLGSTGRCATVAAGRASARAEDRDVHRRRARRRRASRSARSS